VTTDVPRLKSTPNTTAAITETKLPLSTPDMTANPYDPPLVTDDETRDRYRLLFVLMFWLSTILAVLTFASALFVGYQNYVASAQRGGTMPTYIPLLVVLIVCCSSGFMISSLRWRKRRARPAIVSFALSVAVLLFGPYILLMLLYGVRNWSLF
jgi:hypothetical protein